jgi:hypothetical protein
MKILAQAVGLVLLCAIMLALTIFVGVAPETLMYVR